VTALTVGAPVVILEGLPFEVTWDDRDDPAAGLEGVLVAIRPNWAPTPYEVRAADGQTHLAARVRVIDDAYRAEQAAKTARYQAIDLRRLELLEAALCAYIDRPDVPADVHRALADMMSATAGQSSAEFPPE
jgi:hypothetical protein